MSAASAPVRLKILAQSRSVSQSTIEFGLGASENPPAQLQSGQRFSLVQIGINLLRYRAGIDQRAGGAKRIAADRSKAKPAGVGGNGGKQRLEPTRESA